MCISVGNELMLPRNCKTLLSLGTYYFKCATNKYGKIMPLHIVCHVDMIKHRQTSKWQILLNTEQSYMFCK